MPIPSLTELTSGQPNANLAFGSGYAGGVPPLDIDFSNTEKRIQEISAAAAKQKKEDKAQFEKTLASKLQSISKFDGILPNDREAILSDYKQTRDFIIQNSDVFAPGGASKDPKRYAEVENKISEFLAKVDKSKQDKKFEEQLNITLRQKPEYNNEETKALMDQWRTKSVDERTPFMPIDSGDRMWQMTQKQYIANPTGENIDAISPFDIDKGSFKHDVYKYYDKELNRLNFRDLKGEMLTAEYLRKPELQKQYPNGPSEYIDAKADMYFSTLQPKLVSSKIYANREEAQKAAKERAELMAGAAMERTIVSQEGQTQRTQMSIDARDNNSPEQKLQNTKENIRTLLNNSPVQYQVDIDPWMPYLNAENAKALKGYSVTLVDQTALSNLDLTKLYPGGVSRYGDNAYGQLFKISKGGEPKYAIGKEHYVGVSHGEPKEYASKKELDESSAEDKKTLVLPDLRKLYSEDDVIDALLPTSIKNEELAKPQSGQSKTNTKKTKSKSLDNYWK